MVHYSHAEYDSAAHVLSASGPLAWWGWCRCSPPGRLRTQETVRSELRLLFDLLQELDGAAITHTLTPSRTQIADLVVPFKHAEAMATELRCVGPHEALDFLVLAWPHAPLSYQSGAKPKRDFHKERDFWLAGAAGRLGDAFATLKALVFDKLDPIGRASALGERVTALLRPSLNSCKGPRTQELFQRRRFSPQHRRYQSGKRQGKAPLALLTGKL